MLPVQTTAGTSISTFANLGLAIATALFMSPDFMTAVSATGWGKWVFAGYAAINAVAHASTGNTPLIGASSKP